MTDEVERLRIALADRYAIQEELGAGGMATVFLAEDLKHKRWVAVKVLRPELAAALGGERFLKEILVTANLQHPHILPLFDSGQADSFLYYVMPLVEGESLREKLNREKQLTVDESIAITKAVASALDYAHRKGVIHRDIKPENILLQDDQPVVSDFGIALALTAAGGERLTETGLSLGTPHYMSPEQAMGDREVGVPSDVYALGVMLYEMLAGDPPHTGPTAQAIVARVLTENPQPLSGRRDTLPPHVAAAVHKALAKIPADRFDSVAQFADALSTPAPGTLETTSPGPATVAAPRWGGRRTITGIGAAAAVLAAAVLWWSGTSGIGTPDAVAGDADSKSVAVLPFTNTSDDQENVSFTAGIHGDVLTQLTKVADLKVISRTSVMEYAETTKNIRQIGQELGVATILEGSVQRVGDVIRMNVQLNDARTDENLWAETYDRDLTVANLLAIQSDIAQQIARELEAALTPTERDRIEALPTESIEAYNAYLVGKAYVDRPGVTPSDHAAATAQYELAVELDPLFAVAHAALGTLSAYDYEMGYDVTPSRLTVAQEATDLAMALVPDLPEGHLARAALLWGRVEMDSAAAAITAAERGGLRTGALYRQKGEIARARGRWAEATASFGRAAAIDPRSGDGFHLLGETARWRRRYDEAIRHFDRALARQPDNIESGVSKAIISMERQGDTDPLRRFLGALPPGAELWGILPVLRWLVEHLDRDYEAALAVLAGIDRPIVEFRAWVYPPLLLSGTTHQAAGAPLAARAAFDSARVLLEAEVSRRPYHAGLHMALGSAYAGLGRAAEAIAEGRRAVALRPSSRDMYLGPVVLDGLARIYVAVGEYDLAIDTFDEYLSAETGSWSVEGLLLNPELDVLRDQPGFERILAHRN